MPSVIVNGKIVANTWSPVEIANGVATVIPETGDLLVPPAAWFAQREELLSRGRRLGLLLEGSDDPASIANDLWQFDLVAIDFPQAGDGRGYSLSRLLRERYGYRGELRAVGAVPRDNLFYLARCGFDAFSVSDAFDDRALAAALVSLHDFSEAYQSSVERPQPLFRRRPGVRAA